ncbi:putative protein phosphatase [Halotydeus destructor]|nr:putative protein phosphatase [Halotydeus destructor]
MGAYLSAPATETDPTDGRSGNLAYGANSMQGWRTSQEDAHLALLEYDKKGDSKISLFGVFDGHGGAEVAQYTARELPNFIKNIEHYKIGAYESALEEAFLDFDKQLIEPQVIEDLKVLAGTVEESDIEEQANEAILLQEEAEMPINVLLAKYGKDPAGGDEKALSSVPAHLREEVKPKSPFLRAKKLKLSSEASSSKGGEDEVGLLSGMCSSSSDAGGSGVGSSSAGNGEMAADASSTTQNESNNDFDISSSTSSGKLSKAELKTDENGITTSCDGSVSSPSVQKVESNGEVKDTDGNADTTSNGSSGVKNEAEVTPSKPDKGKRKKIIPIRVKKPVEEGPAYEKFLQDFEESDDDEEDEEDFHGKNSDSEDDEEEEEEESSDDDSDDAEETGPLAYMDGEEPGKDSGCTAVVALLDGNELYVANAGDSRCVVSRSGEAIDMSIDHKPEDDIEQDRITRAGGQVTADGRVNGGLNLSRAIGDHAYKINSKLPLREQMITALPDIKKLTISPSDEFMVLACDGIWNSLTSQQVVDYVRPKVRDNKPLSAICDDLFRACLAPNTHGDGTGCDNMTCIIVTFGHDIKTQKRPRETDAQVDTSERSAKRSSLDIEPETGNEASA